MRWRLWGWKRTYRLLRPLVEDRTLRWRKGTKRVQR
jgi:hypothetical protein